MKKIKRSQLREMILESLNEEDINEAHSDKQYAANQLAHYEKQLKEIAQELAVLASKLAGTE